MVHGEQEYVVFFTLVIAYCLDHIRSLLLIVGVLNFLFFLWWYDQNSLHSSWVLFVRPLVLNVNEVLLDVCLFHLEKSLFNLIVGIH